MVTHIDITIDGEPPRKNKRHRIVMPQRGVPFLANTPDFDSFVLRLTNRWRRAGAPKIRAGAWRITIAAFWSRERHLDVRLPIGDIDAPVSAVLDGLQECGALDDDVRFVELVTYKALDRESPRTVITIEAVDEGREQLGLL